MGSLRFRQTAKAVRRLGAGIRLWLVDQWQCGFQSGEWPWLCTEMALGEDPQSEAENALQTQACPRQPRMTAPGVQPREK